MPSIKNKNACSRRQKTSIYRSRSAIDVETMPREDLPSACPEDFD